MAWASVSDSLRSEYAFEMSNSLLKNGSNRLPVMKSKSGSLKIENAKPGAGLKPAVRNEAGATVEVDKVEADPKGGFIFLDKAGKPIVHPKAP